MNKTEPNDNMRKLYARLFSFGGQFSLFSLRFANVLALHKFFQNIQDPLWTVCRLQFRLLFSALRSFYFVHSGRCCLYVICFWCSAQLSSSRYSSYYLIFVRQNIKKVFRSPLAVHYNQHLQCRTMPIITVEVGCFVAVRVMSCKTYSQNAARKLIFYQVMHWLIVLVFLFWKNFHQHRRYYVSIVGRKQTI